MKKIIILTVILTLGLAPTSGRAGDRSPSRTEKEAAKAVINAYWIDYQRWEGVSNRCVLFQCLADQLSQQTREGVLTVTGDDVLKYLGPPDFFQQSTNVTLTLRPDGPSAHGDITEYVYLYTSPRYGPYAKFVTLTNGVLFVIGENTRTANDLTKYQRWKQRE
jgi:hypothetical protein